MRAAEMLIVALCSMACTHNKGDGLYPSVKCAADTIAVVSFAKDIEPVLRANCAVSGCHTGNTAAGNLDLDSAVAYASLWKSGSGYIDTLNPESSLLYSQMTSIASPMPPTGRLDNCTTALVLKWIEQKGK